MFRKSQRVTSKLHGYWINCIWSVSNLGPQMALAKIWLEKILFPVTFAVQNAMTKTVSDIWAQKQIFAMFFMRKREAREGYCRGYWLAFKNCSFNLSKEPLWTELWAEKALLLACEHNRVFIHPLTFAMSLNHEKMCSGIFHHYLAERIYFFWWLSTTCAFPVFVSSKFNCSTFTFSLQNGS